MCCLKKKKKVLFFGLQFNWAPSNSSITKKYRKIIRYLSPCHSQFKNLYHTSTKLFLFQDEGSCCICGNCFFPSLGYQHYSSFLILLISSEIKWPEWQQVFKTGCVVDFCRGIAPYFIPNNFLHYTSISVFVSKQLSVAFTELSMMNPGSFCVWRH